MIEHCQEHVICHYTSALSIFTLDLCNTFDLHCHSHTLPLFARPLATVFSFETYNLKQHSLKLDT